MPAVEGVLYRGEELVEAPFSEGINELRPNQRSEPRLDRFMAAPKLPGAKGKNRCFATYPVVAGNVILFESWLRHEVPVNQTDDQRISVSFNYAWE